MAKLVAESDTGPFDQRRKQGRCGERGRDRGAELQRAETISGSDETDHRHVDEIDAEAQFAGLAQKLDPHDARQQRFGGVEKAVDDPADDERREREDDVVIGLPRARRRQFHHPGVVADERELAERRGEEEGERRDPGDPLA
jgi:hypothetical protein